MSAQPRVPQVSESDRPRGAQIDPASQAALERAESLDAPTLQPAPTGQDTQPGSLAAASTTGVPAYQRPTPRQARIHELRKVAGDRLTYLRSPEHTEKPEEGEAAPELAPPEFTPLTPNHRHPYQAHVAWEQPDRHTLVDWYPDGKTTTLILWDRDRPDGQVVTATSAEADLRTAYHDCERQLRLKRHDVAVLLKRIEAQQLAIDTQRLIVKGLVDALDTVDQERYALRDRVANLEAINTCSQCGDVVEGETVVCQTCYHAVAAPPPATGEHPLDATTLAILRSGWPKLTREGGYFAMLDGSATVTTKRFSFAAALLGDLANPRVDQRGLAWQTLVRAHTGRLEA
jgi:hypothetical protein